MLVPATFRMVLSVHKKNSQSQLRKQNHNIKKRSTTPRSSPTSHADHCCYPFDFFWEGPALVGGRPAGGERAPSRPGAGACRDAPPGPGPEARRDQQYFAKKYMSGLILDPQVGCKGDFPLLDICLSFFAEDFGFDIFPLKLVLNGGFPTGHVFA